VIVPGKTFAVDSDDVAGRDQVPRDIRPATDRREPVAAAPAGHEPADLIWTIPNALSFLRLLGVPLFLWLALGPKADGLALAVLVVSGLTDYLDGKFARAWNQVSRLGALLDPLADRLYIASTLIALSTRGIVPWWLTGFLFARDGVLLALVPLLRRRLGTVALPVHFLGKAATLNLLYAFPFLLLAHGREEAATIARPAGWAFALWGTALYWWAALLYLGQARTLLAGSGQPPTHSRVATGEAAE